MFDIEELDDRYTSPLQLFRLKCQDRVEERETERETEREREGEREKEGDGVEREG